MKKQIQVTGTYNQEITVFVDKIEAIEKTVDDSDATRIYFSNHKIYCNESYEEVLTLINS